MIEWISLRGAEYNDVLSRQEKFFEELKQLKRKGSVIEKERVYFVEHTPVYTLGKHADKNNLIDQSAINNVGAMIFQTNRGGDVTFHGPGQLACYPLLDLEKRRLGVKAYVNLLEQAVIDTLLYYNIIGERLEGATGVWIEPFTNKARKICAIGIKCSRFVTMHGLALNVNTDLSYFNLINPCGFVDKGVTSIANELQRKVDFDEVMVRLQQNLARLLNI